MKGLSLPKKANVVPLILCVDLMVDTFSGNCQIVSTV